MDGVELFGHEMVIRLIGQLVHLGKQILLHEGRFAFRGLLFGLLLEGYFWVEIILRSVLANKLLRIR